jgi:hypothetical protein
VDTCSATISPRLFENLPGREFYLSSISDTIEYVALLLGWSPDTAISTASGHVPGLKIKPPAGLRDISAKTEEFDPLGG